MLKGLLTERKSAILKRWFDQVLKTYPDDTSRFLKREKDPFANPVGSSLKEGLTGILDGLLKEESPEGVDAFLEHIIRIRSLQDFSPSQAIGFILDLKHVVRADLKKQIQENQLHGELAELESRIDALTLLAFDLYVRCREKLYEIRVREVRGHRDAAVRLLERANRSIERMDNGERS